MGIAAVVMVEDYDGHRRWEEGGGYGARKLWNSFNLGKGKCPAGPITFIVTIHTIFHNHVSVEMAGLEVT